MPKQYSEDDYDIVLTKQKPNGKGKGVEKRKKGGNKKDKPVHPLVGGFRIFIFFNFY